jgi:hypothetical protein
MDWWLLMSKLVPMLVVVFATEIILARRNQKRLAQVEAISGDWTRPAQWVGIVVNDHGFMPPPSRSSDQCNAVSDPRVNAKGGLS